MPANTFNSKWLFVAVSMFWLAPVCVGQSTATASYEYFDRLIDDNAGDTVRAAAFAGAWLKKAKAERDWRQMTKAYNAVLHYGARRGDYERYADSMLIAAKRSNDDALIGAAYLKKGLVVYERNKKLALENYLLADQHISKTPDKYQVHKVKYVLAETKFYLGFYDEALSLFLECLRYFEFENDRAYLNTLHALSLCYNRLENIKESDAAVLRGRIAARALDNHQMDRYFDLSAAVNAYYKKQYLRSIDSLKSLLPYFVQRRDQVNATVANFYMARNYWAMKRYGDAVPYLEKVDAAFTDDKYLRPELRKNYEMLIDYYKAKGDLAKKDYYVDRLLHADSILDKNFEYLSGRIYKVYDTRRLLEEHGEKESQRRQVLYYLIGGISAALFISVVVNIIIRRRDRYYFKLAMEREPEREKEAVEAAAKEKKDVLGGDTLENLRQQLAQFEKDRKYLEKNMKAADMAKLFQTNPKYISELVKHFRGKRFTEYINDLRIDHVVELLKTQKKFRNYTNEALAGEGGFGSTQIFTRAFKKRVKISPTTFVSELEAQQGRDNNQPSDYDV